jgi:hypothetical protein
VEEVIELLKSKRYPGNGVSGTEVGWHPVNTLNLSSGELWAGDPQFSWAELRSKRGFRIALDPGNYAVSVLIISFDKMNVVARLRVSSEDAKNPKAGTAVGKVGTDSALIGVGDAKLVWDAFQDKYGSDMAGPPTWLGKTKYGRVGLLQPNGKKGAAITYVNSGFGYGGSSVKALRDGKKLVGVEMVFVTSKGKS